MKERFNFYTFVPFKFLSENLDFDVHLDEESNTAIITTK